MSPPETVGLMKLLGKNINNLVLLQLNENCEKKNNIEITLSSQVLSS